MNIKYWIGICVIILISAIPLFSHLDSVPIQAWDEGRVVSNALEMYEGKSNLLVPTYYSEPEMWNTKPPLLLWLQALCMKILGVGELAVRLPSALAALVLCLYLFWFFHRKMNKPLWGIITCLVLITSQGYIRVHGTRTGDYDSLLTLFTTVYALSFYLYFRERKLKYIYIAFITLGLAVLTKGVAALLFTPGLLFYAFLYKKNRTVFVSKHVYISAFIFVVISLGYYLAREYYNPGYIRTVQLNELGGRYGNTIEGHAGDAWYYYNWITRHGFKYWVVLLPLGLYTGLRSLSQQMRRIIVFSLMLIISHFLIINTAGTKIDWYDMPMYPFMSIIAANFLFTVLRYIRYFVRRITKSKYDILHYLLLIFVFLVPYQEIINFVEDGTWQKETTYNTNMAYFLKDARAGKHDIRGYKLVLDEYEPNLLWYVNIDGGKHKNFVKYSHELLPGDIAAVPKDGTKQYMESIYSLTQIRSYHGVTVFKIHGRKQ
jgi:4-amino-4-deoxy-L-arabinose transferase-like glycosyltransferase